MSKLFVFVALGTIGLWAQPGTPLKECLPVLAKDYYSYASKNNLQEDFIRSIDQESWSKLRESRDTSMTGVFSGGMFSFDDDYKKFEEKRTKYLDNMHYSRNQQQALDILQITTAPRAYSAFESCLRSVGSGPALLVWASKETMSEIELRVKYVNGAGVRSIELFGTVTGGSVDGEPAGSLWSNTGFFSWFKNYNRWGVNEERLFTIKRTPGVSETTVTVKPSDNSTPVRLTFQRADALLTLAYIGTTDVLRQRDRVGSAHTPDNNENRGNCPNRVGMHDGKYCTSRTALAVSTAPPKFLQNARPGCSGGPGCGFTSFGPVSISADGLTASTYVDNWGSAVDGHIYADEHEHMTAAQCGSDRPVPVIKGKPALFSALAECIPIATLKWTLLSDGSQGAMRFGDASSAGGEILRDGPVLSNGSARLASYKLK